MGSEMCIRDRSPRSTVAVESEPHTTEAVAIMDGVRRIAMPAGSRVEVVRGHRPVRWVRLDGRPFSDRLVEKFQLPVSGWRGPKNSQDTSGIRNGNRN